MVGLVEDNLWGTATALAAVYNNTPDRRTFDLGHVNPHFLSRRGWLQAKYSNKSDGNRGTWLVGVPFYETAARHALTTDGEAASERVLLFRDGVPDTTRFSQGQVERRALWFGLTAGFAPRVTTEDYVRLWLAGQWRRENFDSVGTTAFPRSVFGAVGVGMDVGHVRFQVLERFNSYARREDVDISQLLHIGVWAAPRAWGYPSGQAGVGPELSAQLAAPWRRGFAVEARVLVADDLWGLMGVGVAPFLDYGGAWYSDEPARLGGAVGVSLRIGPTRSVRGDVGEFAVGYRFGKGVTGRRWGFAIRKGVRY